MDLANGLLVGILLAIIILISLSVHEFAHAFTANLFGDPTAKLEGRLTLNPLAHWDQVGTSLLVGLIILRSVGLPLPVIGWGKPVPVNDNNFDNPRWSGFQTAIAGPMSNFILAALLGMIVFYFRLPAVAEQLLSFAVYINIFLMFFNLIPIPPLDGSKILRLFMSDQTYFSLSSNPVWFFGLLFLLFFFLLDYLTVVSGRLSDFLLSGW